MGLKTPQTASKARKGPTHMRVVRRPILSEMRPARTAPMRPPMMPALPATPLASSPRWNSLPTALMAPLRTMPSKP